MKQSVDLPFIGSVAVEYVQSYDEMDSLSREVRDSKCTYCIPACRNTFGEHGRKYWCSQCAKREKASADLLVAARKSNFLKAKLFDLARQASK